MNLICVRAVISQMSLKMLVLLNRQHIFHLTRHRACHNCLDFRMIWTGFSSTGSLPLNMTGIKCLFCICGSFIWVINLLHYSKPQLHILILTDGILDSCPSRAWLSYLLSTGNPRNRVFSNKSLYPGCWYSNLLESSDLIITKCPGLKLFSRTVREQGRKELTKLAALVMSLNIFSWKRTLMF